MSNPKVSRSYRLDPEIAEAIANAALAAGMKIEPWVEAKLWAAARAELRRAERRRERERDQ